MAGDGGDGGADGGVGDGGGLAGKGGGDGGEGGGSAWTQQLPHAQRWSTIVWLIFSRMEQAMFICIQVRHDWPRHVPPQSGCMGGGGGDGGFAGGVGGEGGEGGDEGGGKGGGEGYGASHSSVRCEMRTVLFCAPR